MVEEYIGLWRKEIAIPDNTPFDVFYMKIDKKSDGSLSGKGLDYNKGLFRIEGQSIETSHGEILEFSKAYEKKISNTENLHYTSDGINPQESAFVKGVWRLKRKDGLEREGTFVMASPTLIKNLSIENPLEQELLDVNLELLGAKITELRNEFPFYPSI